MRWARYVARMGDIRGANTVLVGRSDGKRPLRRPRRRHGDNITKAGNVRTTLRFRCVRVTTVAVQKVLRITYSEHGSAALCIHHAMRKRRIILPSDARLYHIFPPHLINGRF